MAGVMVVMPIFKSRGTAVRAIGYLTFLNEPNALNTESPLRRGVIITPCMRVTQEIFARRHIIHSSFVTERANA
jgi:hypothetical protein